MEVLVAKFEDLSMVRWVRLENPLLEMHDFVKAVHVELLDDADL